MYKNFHLVVDDIELLQVSKSRRLNNKNDKNGINFKFQLF